MLPLILVVSQGAEVRAAAVLGVEAVGAAAALARTTMAQILPLPKDTIPLVTEQVVVGVQAVAAVAVAAETMTVTMAPVERALLTVLVQSVKMWYSGMFIPLCGPLQLCAK